VSSEKARRMLEFGAQLRQRFENIDKRFRYTPDSENMHEPFTQSGNHFYINNAYLKRTNVLNGVKNCQGYYYNHGRHNYDPQKFAELRNTLAAQGFIEKNEDEFLGADNVRQCFYLNGHEFKSGCNFVSAELLGRFLDRKSQPLT
jgi:hypothetical protein